MAQGSKLKSKSISPAGGKQKRKSVASIKKQQKNLQKGRKTFKAKGAKALENKPILDATKAINKRNEMKASAKAVSAGHTFFLSDIKEKGKKEIHRANMSQHKKEQGSNKLSTRLKKQLKKMGKDI